MNMLHSRLSLLLATAVFCSTCCVQGARLNSVLSGLSAKHKPASVALPEWLPETPANNGPEATPRSSRGLLGVSGVETIEMLTKLLVADLEASDDASAGPSQGHYGYYGYYQGSVTSPDGDLLDDIAAEQLLETAGSRRLLHSNEGEHVALDDVLADVLGANIDTLADLDPYANAESSRGGYYYGYYDGRPTPPVLGDNRRRLLASVLSQPAIEGSNSLVNSMRRKLQQTGQPSDMDWLLRLSDAKWLDLFAEFALSYDEWTLDFLTWLNTAPTYRGQYFDKTLEGFGYGLYGRYSLRWLKTLYPELLPDGNGWE